MIIATAAVCLGMDAVTFTAMSFAKPHIKRVLGDTHIADATRRVVVTRVAAAKRAYSVYQSTIRSA